jgi:chromosome segregation ATPase
MTKQEMQTTIDELNDKLSNQSKMIAELATHAQEIEVYEEAKELADKKIESLEEQLNHYKEQNDSLFKIASRLEDKIETYKEVIVVLKNA